MDGIMIKEEFNVGSEEREKEQEREKEREREREREEKEQREERSGVKSSNPKIGRPAKTDQ